MAHPRSDPAGGTVVAVVGDDAADALEHFDRLPGVETLALGDTEPALATRRIAAAAKPWIVHDADPLVHVAAAWVELYEERSTLGVLETEVDAALEAFREGNAIMPDYYVVLDPDSADATWRHWWCGALGHWAPRRIHPMESHAGLRSLLKALPTSRPWPAPEAWLPNLPFDIPDRVGLSRSATSDRR
jgi:hypothetical protein